jgi:hypothetical protein
MSDIAEVIIEKRQDGDGHWFWIPVCLIAAFEKDLEGISGIEYMEDPDAFDKFSEKYEMYRTGGSPDLVPDIYLDKVVDFKKEKLRLSQEELETIEDLAASNYTPSQIAVYLSLDKKEFLELWNNPESTVRHHYEKGKLSADFEINQKLLDNARSGNITAAQIFEKNRDRVNVENLKQQIFFGHGEA